MVRKSSVVLTLMLVSVSILLSAAAAAADSAPSKESWIGQMSAVLPGVMCAPNQYFRKCFNIDQNSCNDEAVRAVKSCAARYAPEMPAVFLPKDGENWGRIISECVYEALESNLQTNNKITSGDCKDLSKRQ
ncbi:MAG: hypothetical protein HQK99_06220 [Nitrospirae bacterium]|nr:hypothetical protein [Nitrospirota bacterium]